MYCAPGWSTGALCNKGRVYVFNQFPYAGTGRWISYRHGASDGNFFNTEPGVTTYFNSGGFALAVGSRTDDVSGYKHYIFASLPL